jgi:putative flippase GtrA
MMTDKLWEFTRFALVGAIATATYAAMATLMTTYTFAMFTTTAVALSTSLLVSFVGHRHFSFRQKGPHAPSGAGRFVLASIVLIALFSYFAELAVSWLGAASPTALAFTCVFYPFASYAVHSTWTFKTPLR